MGKGKRVGLCWCGRAPRARNLLVGPLRGQPSRAAPLAGGQVHDRVDGIAVARLLPVLFP